MALFSMKLETLQNLFVEQLRDLYDGEQQITKALPKMIEKANHNDLKDALQEHLDVTREQIRRLDQIFNLLGEDASGETCKGMKGVISEGESLISDAKDASVLDAGIIASAQRVEHYEIAGYGTVRTYARLLGRNDIAELLQQTLDEEKEADQTLNEIAESVNIEAKAA
jgi:ferritin-like metal-binding protein YciE